ncbi:MAG: non-hydrolyzing UDP-N-acetylglucosamine 2-epimerase [Candidatus Hodarchaeota archaeon]
MNGIIYIIGGARPNFMKISPIIEELNNESLPFKLIHTGQHYDYNMSKIFFDDLGIQEPDYFLNAGSGSHAIQTAKIMIEFEKILLEKKPDLVIVVGDVNSTIACALVAKKLFIKVAHIEAGLRSFDETMPEEINRILTDQLADLLFITEESAKVNLLREGIKPERIFFVGNIMIDNLINSLEKAADTEFYKNYNLEKKQYVLVTLHRPSNVDNKKDLEKIVEILNYIGKSLKILFPIHPRTKKNLINYDLIQKLENKNITITNPVGYHEFLNLMINSKLILTDSGGIQEEASYLKIPVLTMRKNTERPITIKKGTNCLVGNDIEKIKTHFNQILLNKYKKGTNIEKWDGRTAKRIVEIIKRELFIY